MMDQFQNCVSEFDLNLFEQNGNQGTPLNPCPVSRKLGIARLKERLKGVSQVVHKAKNTNEILLEVQKELLDTKQELEDTRNLLFEKNEEHKVICDERSTYFNQATEYSNEIQKLKEQLKNFGELDFDAKLKDKIISGYSDQMKGLQTEMDNLLDDKKQKEKSASFALKQTKAHKALVEKKLVRLLKEYVVPTIKKRDRWLESIIKKYLPETHKEEDEEVEESNKGEKVGEGGEKHDDANLDDEELHTSTQPSLNRNISLDFDFVGSVDTGRGSSLALSDGEKSFHSPDYYMSASPPCNIPNIICNQCNVTKLDVSTSPMSPERYGIPDNSATNLCKRCTLLARKDACTSPIPSRSLDTATNTSDDFIEAINPRKYVTSNLEIDSNVKQTLINVSNISQITPTSYKKECDYNEISTEHMDVSNKEPITSKKLQDFTFDSDEEGDDLVSNVSGIASPVEELNTSSPIQFDKVVSNIQIILSNEAPTAASKSPDDIGIDVDDNDDYLQNDSIYQSRLGETPIISPRRIEAASTIRAETEAHSRSVKLHNNTESDIDDDEAMLSVSLIKNSNVLSPIDFDVTASNCPNIANNEPPITPTKLQNKPPDLNINMYRKTQQELECLELNNSNNCSNDVEINTEIRTILDKMRLRYPIISPIPATPPRRKVQSPGMPSGNRNATLGQQAELVAETINEQINLLRTKIREVFTPFIDTMPQYLGQIPRLFSDGNLNEELLRNLLHNPNRNYEKHSYHENEQKLSSYHVHAKSNIRHQPDVVDLDTGSMLCITETNENKDSSCNDYTIMTEDSEEEDQLIIIRSNNQPHDEICTLNKEITHVLTNNKMSDASLLKSEQSHVACLNSNFTADSSFNRNNDVQATHENTHQMFENNAECDDNILVSVVNSNTAASSSVIESRNSIVYESVDISDVESDVPISELVNSVESCNENTDAHRKRRGNLKKVSKLEAFRLKMLPKNKIKNHKQTKAVTKLQYKPIHMSSSKRKVTEADTAASLNDKSVYENAVKVVAALRSSKVPKVIIKDCILHTEDNLKTETKNTDEKEIDNSSKPQSPKARKNNKRKLSVNFMRENCTDSNKSLGFNDTKKGKKSDSRLNENISEKSPKKPKQKMHDIPPQKRSFSISDVETPNTKRTQEVVHTSDSSEIKELKRKRTSVSDRKTPPPNSKSNDKIVVPDSPRILRSSTHVKHNKEAIKDTPIVIQTRAKLRSKMYQNEPETCDNTSVLSLGTKPRVTRQNVHSISESTKIDLTSPVSDTSKKNNDTAISYADLDLFSNKDTQEEIKPADQYRKDSLLCQMIEKYGVQRIKLIAKKAPEAIVTGACQRLETSLSEILEVPHEEYLGAMKKLVAEVRTWQEKDFVLGLIKFLRNPERKIELFSKSICPPFPPMTKREQVLLYVLDELQKSYEYRNVVQKILLNIEYNLLALNKTAETFDVIETMSHFYALLCRSYQKISQLRVFIIEAMYCLQLKSVILVQQCLEVWMSVLPLGHMGLAKCPLVTCLVYLLHFYKCEDKYKRVQEIRNTLRWKYNYDLKDWNENMILDMFRTAIIEIRDTPMERKTLRLALLILAKRNGAKWCHNMIVKNMLQPLINDSSTTERTKRFCLSLLGPLLKPYPGNMKVHYEMVIDYLMDMLQKKNSARMQEAIISSLIYVDKNNYRLHQFLAKWTPKHVSLDFELVFKDYVRSKSVAHWKKILSWKM